MTVAAAAPLPELHLADWRATKDTLHLYCQILGKVRLATTSPRNHWWNVPLYVDVRGLTTRRLHQESATFELSLDFLDDALVVGTGVAAASHCHWPAAFQLLTSTRRFIACSATWALTSRSSKNPSASR